MSGASAPGEKLPLIVIGKAKNLRYFKNVNSLLCMFKAQTKSWMDSVHTLNQTVGSKVLNSES